MGLSNDRLVGMIASCVLAVIGAIFVAAAELIGNLVRES
jgi:hypothetical protein